MKKKNRNSLEMGHWNTANGAQSINKPRADLIFMNVKLSAALRNSFRSQWRTTQTQHSLKKAVQQCSDLLLSTGWFSPSHPPLYSFKASSEYGFFHCLILSNPWPGDITSARYQSTGKAPFLAFSWMQAAVSPAHSLTPCNAVLCLQEMEAVRL